MEGGEGRGKSWVWRVHPPIHPPDSSAGGGFCLLLTAQLLGVSDV